MSRYVLVLVKRLCLQGAVIFISCYGNGNGTKPRDLRAFGLAFFMSISPGSFETHRLVSNIGLKEVIAACLSDKYELNST